MKELSGEYNELSSLIIGSAIEVHRILGPGFLESVYEESMCKELQLRGLSYACQHGCIVNYKDTHVGEGRIDLLVEHKIIVELKAVEALAPIHSAQVISYLKMTKLPLGLLFNFNVTKLMPEGFRRIILT
jgi:GxxExxY protein